MVQKIMELLKKYREVIMYLIFGVLTTVVSIGSFSFFVYGTKIDPLISNVLSWIIAVLFAYVTNRKWVFKTKATGTKEVTAEMLKFVSGRIATLLMEEAMLLVFINLLHFHPVVVKIAAQFMVVVANYVISKLFVFK